MRLWETVAILKDRVGNGANETSVPVAMVQVGVMRVGVLVGAVHVLVGVTDGRVERDFVCTGVVAVVVAVPMGMRRGLVRVEMLVTLAVPEPDRAHHHRERDSLHRGDGFIQGEPRPGKPEGRRGREHELRACGP